MSTLRAVIFGDGPSNHQLSWRGKNPGSGWGLFDILWPGWRDGCGSRVFATEKTGG